MISPLKIPYVIIYSCLPKKDVCFQHINTRHVWKTSRSGNKFQRYFPHVNKYKSVGRLAHSVSFKNAIRYLLFRRAQIKKVKIDGALGGHQYCEQEMAKLYSTCVWDSRWCVISSFMMLEDEPGFGWMSYKKVGLFI